MALAGLTGGDADLDEEPPTSSLYDPAVTAPIGSSVARDVQTAAATWRPQRLSEKGGDVQDPLIEPLWTGLRVLAAVDGDSVVLRDIDGDTVEEFDDVAAELAAARLAERIIVDGYLTHQVLQEPAVIATCRSCGAEARE